jgi:hypothetical protein
MVIAERALGVRSEVRAAARPMCRSFDSVPADPQCSEGPQ